MNSDGCDGLFAVTELGVIGQVLFNCQNFKKHNYVQVIDPGKDPNVRAHDVLPGGPYLAVTKYHGIFYYGDNDALPAPPPDHCQQSWRPGTRPIIVLGGSWLSSVACQQAILSSSVNKMLAYWDQEAIYWAQAINCTLRELAHQPHIFADPQGWPAPPSTPPLLPVLT